jgi:hypothetical protein
VGEFLGGIVDYYEEHPAQFFSDVAYRYVGGSLFAVAGAFLFAPTVVGAPAGAAAFAVAGCALGVSSSEFGGPL